MTSPFTKKKDKGEEKKEKKERRETYLENGLQILSLILLWFSKTPNPLFSANNLGFVLEMGFEAIYFLTSRKRRFF